MLLLRLMVKTRNTSGYVESKSTTSHHIHLLGTVEAKKSRVATAPPPSGSWFQSWLLLLYMIWRFPCPSKFWEASLELQSGSWNLSWSSWAPKGSWTCSAQWGCGQQCRRSVIAVAKWPSAKQSLLLLWRLLSRRLWCGILHFLVFTRWVPFHSRFVAWWCNGVMPDIFVS